MVFQFVLLSSLMVDFAFTSETRNKRGFNQVYYDGSTAHNFDCKYGGCGGVLGGRVGTGDVFVQSYNDFSRATNYGKREAIQEGIVRRQKREADFIQTYHHNSHASNYGKRDSNNKVKRDADFIQNFNDFSHATNYGKRDADFLQNYNDNSHATNVDGVSYAAAAAVPSILLKKVYPAPLYTNGGDRFVQQYNHNSQAVNYGSNGGDRFVQQYNHNSQAVNYGKRKREAQFYQNNHGGSVSHNYDCKFGGCEANVFNQRYLAGSLATNIDYGRK